MLGRRGKKGGWAEGAEQRGWAGRVGRGLGRGVSRGAGQKGLGRRGWAREAEKERWSDGGPEKAWKGG